MVNDIIKICFCKNVFRMIKITILRWNFMRTELKKWISLALLVLCVLSCLPLHSFAGSDFQTNNNEYRRDSKKYLTYCKDKDAYKNPRALQSGDHLFSCDTIDIVISNFASKIEKDGKIYFLKTSPYVPSLSLDIEANPKNMSNVNSEKVVELWNDTDNSVDDYGYAGKVGKGLLYIEYTDYKGNTETYAMADVLNSNVDTPVWFGQEGSYRVGLCFETRRFEKREREKILGFKIGKEVDIYTYNNYRMDFEFEIRNGNTMLFLFDDNGAELKNGAVTSGFSIDLADSHYLDIRVKREVTVDQNSLQEDTDTRINTVANEKVTYNEEGIYTLTAYNSVTNETTTKRILVCNNTKTSPLVRMAANTYPTDFVNLVETPSEKSPSVTEETFDPTPVAFFITCALISLLAIVGIIFLIKKMR